MTNPAPFNESLLSPIGRLVQLRSGASESVVREGHSSDVQSLMARPGDLESRLWNALATDAEPRLRLLVLTGSAGSGKSATLNHLLARQEAEGDRRIGERLADATHSDAPDRGQAERLAEFFIPFRDGAPEPVEECRVVAMNTGMALRFFLDLPGVPEAPALSELQALLRMRLGLSTRGLTRPSAWLHGGVLVVNLDHRTTAGPGGALFEEILARFDPSDPGGVFEGAHRCATCEVRDWCWPMANAQAISAGPGRRSINEAAGDIALSRGRQLAPRALWDAAAELALGGLTVSGQDGRDPCYAIADFAGEADEAVLVHTMACNAALGPVLISSGHLQAAADSSLVSELATREPSYDATSAAHELIADAGLDPEADADQMRRFLRGSHDTPHPAAGRAASALERGAGASADGNRTWGRVLARAAWLGGELAGITGMADEFARALQAQAAGETEASNSPGGNALDAALRTIEDGLAAVFGLRAGPEHYFPTSTPLAGAKADLMVQVRLLEDGKLRMRANPVIAANPAGAELVQYQPLGLSLEVDGKGLQVDYPLWCLLSGAANGGEAPTTVDLERFLALRQAIGAVGVQSATEGNRALLIRERGAGGRRFRVVARNAATGALRATEIL